MTTSAGRLDSERVTGLLLGAAAGDALGWPQEDRSNIVGGQKARNQLSPQPHYHPWERTAGSRFSGRYRDPVQPGEYSDDTQLLCAVARSLLTGPRWYERLTEVELPAWRSYQRGGGGAVLRAAAAWAEGRPPWVAGSTARQRDAAQRYRRAGANGVAMRIAPHVIAAANRTEDDLFGRVVTDGLTTHGHPRALVGALLYAGTLRAALGSTETVPYGALLDAARKSLVDEEIAVAVLPPDWGDTAAVAQFREAWQAALSECGDMLDAVERSLARGAMSDPEEALREIGCIDSAISGAGTVTAVGAVYLASRNAARPMSGLLTAAFLRKADTDTLASMTGALLGAVHGGRWLGELAGVQDADYLVSLGEQLATGARWDAPTPSRAIRQAATQLQSEIAGAAPDQHGEFVDGRWYRLLSLHALEDETRARAKLALEDGQTVIVDVPSRDLPSRDVPSRDVPSRDVPSRDVPSRDLPSRNRSQDAPPATGAAERAPTALPRPDPPARQPSGRPAAGPVEVSLLTANAHRIGAFYARLLGRDVEVLPQRRVRVADCLVFRETEGDNVHGAEHSQICFTVPDLAESARQLQAEIGRGPHGDEARGRDPDGRWVLLRQAGDASPAG
ncbi:ADP-ribosylglycohydrolase family protein [Geodermatophilus sp. SYSU D00700]